MANQGPESMSIEDFPNEILVIIARRMHGDTLGTFATLTERLRSVAAKAAEYLRVPFISDDLRSLVMNPETRVRILDLSNCHARSEQIKSLIFSCPFITELNVVNSGLKFMDLLNVVMKNSLLERLSFSLLDSLAEIPCYQVFPASCSVRRLYLETASSNVLMMTAMIFINKCDMLRKLHINLIGQRLLHQAHPNNLPRVLLKCALENTLKTVIVSRHASNLTHARVILDCLFIMRLEKLRFQRWKDQIKSCYIYDNGNWDRLEVEHESDVLRDAYQILLSPGSEDAIELPWGTPRGLKLNCPLSLDSHRFRMPETLLSAKELDLTDCYWIFPEDVWANLLESSPGLEALAINMGFLKSNETDNLCNPQPSTSSPKRPRLNFSLLRLLRKVKLKQLWITGLGVPQTNSSNDCPQTSNSFRDLKHLSHLEELTLDRVEADATIFEALAHGNVRILRLYLTGIDSVLGLKDMIERSPRLKYFKLEVQKLKLDSQILWDALTTGKHALKQICLATALKDSVTVDTLVSYLPALIQNLNVLHIHAGSAPNCLELHKHVSAILRQYAEQNPHQNFQFLPVAQPSLSRIENIDVPASFPGRSLCTTAHYIARIKADGWDLRS